MQAAKLPHDASNEKAQELQLSDFGPLYEVMEQAKPLRFATNRREASDILKMIAQQGPLTSKSGLTAHLTSKTIGKIVSGDALNKSFGIAAHYQAAVNLDRLFPMAIEPWQFELNPEKNNQGLKARRYLFSPMQYIPSDRAGEKKVIPDASTVFLYEDTMVIVKFTVKEYLNPDNKNSLYSIEALDIILGQKK